MERILHISPTDIRYDSRILKELRVLENIENSYLKAFGIADMDKHADDTQPPSYVKTYKLFSKKLNFLPRSVLYFINLIEAMFRLTFPAIRFSPTVIHCHDTLYLPIALIVKLFRKSKLIYDAHELESNKAGQSRALSKFTLWIEKFSWKNIDVIISVSNSILEWYSCHLGVKESVLILNSPMFENKQTAHGDYFRKKFLIPIDKKIFLYLGIINRRGRAIDIYLDAFRRKDIESHVVFMGYGEYSSEIENVAREFPNIHYHPAVPHEEVVAISKSADVGLCVIEKVSLSDYFCLPNKLFEYAFAGLPVLASNFPDISKVVRKYRLGKCCDVDAESVANSIIEFENENCKTPIADLTELSWQTQQRKLIRVYNGLLNPSNMKSFPSLIKN